MPHKNNILPEVYQESKELKLKNFKILNKMGTGSYASVHYALDKYGNEYAVKLYQKYKLVEGHRRKNLRREISMMNKLGHESIIQLYNVIETKRQIALIMEYIGKKTLQTFVRSQPRRRVKEEKAKYIFR